MFDEVFLSLSQLGREVDNNFSVQLAKNMSVFDGHTLPVNYIPRKRLRHLVYGTNQVELVTIKVGYSFRIAK